MAGWDAICLFSMNCVSSAISAEGKSQHRCHAHGIALQHVSLGCSGRRPAGSSAICAGQPCTKPCETASGSGLRLVQKAHILTPLVATYCRVQGLDRPVLRCIQRYNAAASARKARILRGSMTKTAYHGFGKCVTHAGSRDEADMSCFRGLVLENAGRQLFLLQELFN